MQYEPTTPQQDGFSMPAEFSPHQGCILIWPERPGLVEKRRSRRTQSVPQHYRRHCRE